MIEPLPLAQLDTALRLLPRWTYHEDRRAICQQLRFADFGEALAAMVRIGIAAEKADHHPEWSNVYNRLDILLTTHDADGVTSRDLEMARIIDLIAPCSACP